MEEKMELKSSGRRTPLVVGVCVATLLVVVGCTAFLGVYFSKVEEKLQWVSYHGHFGDNPVAMNEQVEVINERKLIVHMNPDGVKAGINNSVTLNDYNVGLQASRVVGDKTECHIMDLPETFEEALDMIKNYKATGDSGNREISYRSRGDLIHQADLERELGKDIAGFCRGFPTYRLGETVDPSREARAALLGPSCCCCHCCHRRGCHCRR